MLNATDEIVSFISSMCKTTNKSKEYTGYVNLERLKESLSESKGERHAEHSYPKLGAGPEQKWVSISSSIDKNARALKELRDVTSSVVHTYSLLIPSYDEDTRLSRAIPIDYF
uniref:Uncharacterized protein n=1 Tax=Solanum lycopersicum TaxID=4081 RepID=A0A3Q7HQP0_SOLLC